MHISTLTIFALPLLFGLSSPAPAPYIAGEPALAIRQLPTLLPTASQTAPAQAQSSGAGLSAGNQNGSNDTMNNGPSGGSDNGSNNPSCTYDNFDLDLCNDGDINVSPTVNV